LKRQRAARAATGGPFRLDGRSAVVTGGLGLIGGSIAKALAAAGARVVIVDRIPGDRSVAKQFSGNVRFERADVSRPEAIPEFVAGLDRKLGGLDVWVNCAYPRTGDWGVPPEKDKAASWRKNVEMQMVAACLAADHAAQRMAKRGGGSIVNMASIYGMVGPDFGIYQGTSITMPAAYAAIKGGIVGHTRFLASYYGPRGVRVNVICPGGVEAGQPPRFVKQYGKRTALRRMAKAEELGPPAVFLASEASSYVTGAVLMVDGGWTAI
jgi:NAD(P)-dependent dehydrogenase (short-subunit alcohol dehydrogenase family)